MIPLKTLPWPFPTQLTAKRLSGPPQPPQPKFNPAHCEDALL